MHRIRRAALFSGWWLGLLWTPALAEDVERAAPDAPPNVLALQFRPLVDVLRQALADPALEGALVGVQVDSLRTGRTIFAHNPDQLINPASVSKMFTTAAALCLLHPDYRFRTEVYAAQKPERGVLKGPLYLKGTGDPFLVSERLTYLASELRALDLRQVDGPLILDDSAFDDEENGPGWSQDSSPRPYQSPMGALSLNFNSVAILVFPGEALGKPARLELMPDSDHFKLENQTTTVPRGTRLRFLISTQGGHTRIAARGQVALNHPGHREYVRITQPALYTGYSFLEALKREGIKVRQTVRRGVVPPSADLLTTLRSPSLGELVVKVNKRSQNFMAEQLFKVLGAEFLGPPASWYKGEQVIQAFLEQEACIPRQTYVLHNGSGLNDVNRVTAGQVVTLLRSVWRRFDASSDFVSSLAVGGADGTVAGRFTAPDVTRALRVKTGSLENTRALAGYVHTRGDEVLAFCLLVSRYPGSGRDTQQVIDRFAATLARANADYQVVEQIEVEPLALPPPGEDGLIPLSAGGSAEGPEEADVPRGETRAAEPPEATP